MHISTYLRVEKNKKEFSQFMISACDFFRILKVVLLIFVFYLLFINLKENKEFFQVL